MQYRAWNTLLAVLASLCGALMLEMLRAEAAPRWVYGIMVLTCLAGVAFVFYKSNQEYKAVQEQANQNLSADTRIKLEELRAQRQKAVLGFLRSELLWTILISAIALSIVMGSLRP